MNNSNIRNKRDNISSLSVNLVKSILIYWRSLYNFSRRFYHFMSALEVDIRIKIFVAHIVGILSHLIFLLGSLAIIPFISYVVKPESALSNKWLAMFHKMVTPWTDIDFAIILGITSIVIFIIARGASVFGKYVHASINVHLHVYYTVKLFHYFISKKSFDSQTTTAQMTNAINARLPGIIEGFINPVFNLIGKFFFIGAGFIILFLLDPFLLLLALAMTLTLLFVSIGAAGKKIRRYSEGVNNLTLAKQKRIINAIQMREYIQMIGKENIFSKNFATIKREMEKNKLKLAIINILFAPIGEVVLYSAMVFISLYAIVFAGNDEIQLVSAFFIIIFRLFPAINDIFETYMRIKQGVVTYDSISQELIEALLTPISYKQHIRNPLPFRDSIKLTNVSYHYSNQTDKNFTLRKINLKIPSGQKIGICGLSGSGKTTLLRVLTGIITPKAGTIEVDSIQIKGSRLIRRWQDAIGYVSQNLVLIEGSITDNISLTLGDEKIDQKQLYKSIKMAAAHQFINKMPEKEHTQAGEGGSSMSAGQRQRIVIARALYHKPLLLIFDEATSSLDKQTESKILNNIAKDNSINETFIFVTHRLDTIKNCDLIIFMENGKIRGQGTYKDLIKIPNFRKLTVENKPN